VRIVNHWQHYLDGCIRVHVIDYRKLRKGRRLFTDAEYFIHAFIIFFKFTSANFLIAFILIRYGISSRMEVVLMLERYEQKRTHS